MHITKCFFVLYLLITIIICNSCKKDESEYEGNWEGTTSQDLPISFKVDEKGCVELEVSVRVIHPGVNISLKSYYGCVEKGKKFNGKIIPVMNTDTVVEGLGDISISFSSANEAKGTIKETQNLSYYIMSGDTKITAGDTYLEDISFTATKE